MSDIPALMASENDLQDLANELNKSFSAKEGQQLRPTVAAPPTNSAGKVPTSSSRAIDQPSKLPIKISGGFDGLGSDLDHHARQWKNAVRVLEQLRPQMEAVELEGGRLQASLARVIPEIADNSKSLSSHIGAAKAGDLSGDLGSKFSISLAKLDELERLSEALTANHLAMQSTWEQYARAVLQAQRLRDGFQSS